MDKHHLALSLRQRFDSYATGKDDMRETFTDMSDDAIIEISVMCPKCGELYVSIEWVFRAIELSPTVEEFLNLTDGRRAHLHEYVDEDFEDFMYHLRPNDYSHPLGSGSLVDLIEDE